MSFMNRVGKVMDVLIAAMFFLVIAVALGIAVIKVYEAYTKYDTETSITCYNNNNAIVIQEVARSLTINKDNGYLEYEVDGVRYSTNLQCITQKLSLPKK